MILFFKTIPIPKPGYDIFTVRTYFFTKPCDVYINGAIKNNYFVTPYSVQHFVARKYPVFIFQQKFQYFKFLFGKRYLNSFERYFLILQ